MVNVEFSESITEVLDILNHMDKTYTDKIPEKFKNFLEENKSKSYTSNLDHSKKIKEMNIKEKTKDLLATIYMNYWSTPEQKSNYVKILNENEQKYQKEIRQKYDLDNIFKKNNRQTIIKDDISKNNVIQLKGRNSNKFINKIKNILYVK